MKIYELISKIEKRYPADIQEKWDNSSLQIGSENDVITGIVVGLDVTFELIENAIKNNSNLIITHHPLLFDEITNITDDITSKKIKTLIKNEINVYSLHTNYDKVDMHRKCASYLGLENTELMSNDIGIIGEVKNDISIYDLSNLIKDKFCIKDIMLYSSNKKNTIKKIAVVPGSGKDYLDESILRKADVLITGDVSYHVALRAVEENIIILDVTHDGLEKIFVKEFSNFLRDIVNDINIIENDSKNLCKII